ncbi:MULTISPECIES: DUF4091 domain-containing protein [unclassified Actinomyces]|uniref:DUF4091 domain-containing protein n=1 Tax=unclassified Actinomyces TaxID=2609248 RepID=UPI002018328F|nr:MULTISPECIES: DUF4091 domain-containing protein [unclassified Actinomyces]MCL3778691.1 DUF4091 domain-containing protein [Actinomyces sp. AC-20-1]MCL3789972.1 DUF4091 domain-containing protein [Actinomyces sp. 187325]MCL3792309.1 DUF4091 domain-containing protein [Actinomyces sp. 186855]MCL3794513.1 DUF4091 domain-containing protein [Actinomyces sp. 217892]
MPAPSWDFLLCDSLEKVFTDTRPRPLDPAVGLSVFLGEGAGFQVAFDVPCDSDSELVISVDDASAPFTSLCAVECVPCQAVDQKTDEHYLRTASGRYPDLLRPLADGRVPTAEPGWHAVWVEVEVGSICDAGPRPVTVTARLDGDVVLEQTVLVNVLPRTLPPLGVEHTEWFHCDALADRYEVPVFSEAHWRLIDAFIACAARMDVTMILTPTWTPPLDTAVGSYRTPVQLIDVRVDDGVYSFEFSRLRRWMDVCRRHGVRSLEIPHLFTQWGARATPAVYATVDGQARRVFGWDVAADDPRYREFLEALMPQLLAVLSDEWGLDRVCFHVSDEPHGEEQRNSYRLARDVVAPLLRGLRMVDALSDLELHTQGLVQVPVAANDAIAAFLEAGVEPLWTYYCMAQQLEVANRFVALPSVRNRVLAPQMYKSGVRGFLHWGFNFYYSELSARLVDPFRDTTAGGAFPSGDAFIVYPGDDGRPLESIRYRVMRSAMADLRAMELLESLRGRRAVLDVIDLDGTLAFDRFSYDATAYLAMRERLNAAIMRA